jgi:hypothetical protein
MSPRHTTEAGAVRSWLLLWIPAIFAPSVALLVCTPHAPDTVARQALLAAAAVAALVGLLALQAVRPVGLTILLNLAALAFLWAAVRPDLSAPPVVHLAQAVLIFVPTILFGQRVLVVSGANDMRRAALAIDQLRQRTDWPKEPAKIRSLPDVQELRSASRTQPAFALALLSDAWFSLRLAALAALEGRPTWRTHEKRMVLAQFETAAEPAVRAACLDVLGSIDDRPLIDTLARGFEDSSQDVRQAAARALVIDRPSRWNWVREHVHAALANPTLSNDGPLLSSGSLPPAAVPDIMAWIAEGGTLAGRATLSLIAYYRSVLQAGGDEKMIADLRQQVIDDRTPPMLRVELAHLLHSQRWLDDEVLLHLLEPTVPTPLRLLAAETLLNSKTHQQSAEIALREIGLQPNRELALVTASVVQRCLGVDMGLMLGQPLPELHTRQAVEVARRVMDWANRPLPPANDEAKPLPTPPPGQDSGGSGVRLW